MGAVKSIVTDITSEIWNVSDALNQSVENADLREMQGMIQLQIINLRAISEKIDELL